MISPAHSSSNVCPKEGLTIEPTHDDFFTISYIQNIEEETNEPETSTETEEMDVEASTTYSFEVWRDYIHASTYDELVTKLIALRYDANESFDFSERMTLAEYNTYKEYVRMVQSAAKKIFDAKDDKENPYALNIFVAASEDMKSITDIRQMSLNDAKAYLVAVTKTMLAAYLENNPLMSNVHGGLLKPYTCTTEKQQQLIGMLTMYSMMVSAGQTMDLTWNASGETCEIWTYEELATLSAQIFAYVLPLAEKQRVYEKLILAATSIDELVEMKFDYSE